jgi:hypothetical protein
VAGGRWDFVVLVVVVVVSVVSVSAPLLTSDDCKIEDEDDWGTESQGGTSNGRRREKAGSPGSGGASPYRESRTITSTI